MQLQSVMMKASTTKVASALIINYWAIKLDSALCGPLRASLFNQLLGPPSAFFTSRHKTHYLRFLGNRLFNQSTSRLVRSGSRLCFGLLLLVVIGAISTAGCASADENLGFDDERSDSFGSRRWPTSRKGDSDVNVIVAQHLLRHHGDSLDVTGLFDSATDAAVRAYQSSRGLSVDGVIGRNTWGKLLETVRPNHQGDAVRAVQDILLQGYEYKIEVDGDYDRSDQELVMKFQKDMCLRWVDGIIGLETWYTLLTDQSQCTDGGKTSGGGGAAEVAARILAAHKRGAIRLLPIQVSGTNDGADALSNIRDVANGSKATRSSYGNAPGGSVNLSVDMLSAIDDYVNNQKKSCQINAFVGGSHSRNSTHYQGRSVDIQVQGNSRSLMTMCRDAGATRILGPGDAGHSTHVHCQW